MASSPQRWLAIAERDPAQLLDEWMARQLAARTMRPDLITDAQLRDDSRRFLTAFLRATHEGDMDVSQPAWSDVRDVVAQLSRRRAQRGFTPSETATFVLSLKEPLFRRVGAEPGGEDDAMDATWQVTQVLDGLALLTMEAFQQTREEIIMRQQRELLELSTPVVRLWKDILALPLVGTLDSARTQVVMESLLQKIVDTGSAIAIIDITGVPTVDTLVAQHLLKTVAATRLMGADCIISGIRPQIAQTIVHLGIDLSAVATKASLSDAFALALKRRGLTVVSTSAAQAAARG